MGAAGVTPVIFWGDENHVSREERMKATQHLFVIPLVVLTAMVAVALMNAQPSDRCGQIGKVRQQKGSK